MDFQSVVKRQSYAWILISIPIILFAIYIFKYAVNVPYNDDMELVNSVNELKNDGTSLLSLLVQQQNDHRSAFPRLGIFLSYLIAGTSDFRLCILLGYFNLALLGFAFYLVLRSVGKSVFAFIPISLLLFSPIVYQVHLWSLTAFQHTLSIAFSILCLFFLQPNRAGQWIWSFFFAALASLTNLDGISVMLVGVFWLITQKRWRESIWCAIFFGVSVLMYFSDFHLSEKDPIVIDSHTIPIIFRCLIIGTGSLAKIISDSYAPGLSFLFGVIMILSFGLGRVQVVKTRGIKRLFSFDLSEIVFLKLVLSMAVIALGRFSTGIETMTAIRFSVYSVSLAAAFYILLLKIFKGRFEKRVVAFSLIIALLLSAYSYVKYENAVNYLKAGMMADTYNYPRNRIFLHQYFNLPDPDPSFFRNYIFPTHFDDRTVSTWRDKINNGVPEHRIYWSVEDFKAGEGNGYIHNFNKLSVECDDPSVPATDVYMILENKEKKGPVYLVAMERAGGNRLIRLLRRDNRLFFSAVLMRKIPPGDYKMALVWNKNNNPEVRVLKSTIKL